MKKGESTGVLAICKNSLPTKNGGISKSSSKKPWRHVEKQEIVNSTISSASTKWSLSVLKRKEKYSTSTWLGMLPISSHKMAILVSQRLLSLRRILRRPDTQAGARREETPRLRAYPRTREAHADRERAHRTCLRARCRWYGDGSHTQ